MHVDNSSMTVTGLSFNLTHKRSGTESDVGELNVNTDKASLHLTPNLNIPNWLGLLIELLTVTVLSTMNKGFHRIGQPLVNLLSKSLRVYADPALTDLFLPSHPNRDHGVIYGKDLPRAPVTGQGG